MRPLDPAGLIVHEAAHAVAAWSLDARVLFVSVEPHSGLTRAIDFPPGTTLDYYLAGVVGEALTGRHGTLGETWARGLAMPGRTDATRARYHALVEHGVLGDAAERFMAARLRVVEAMLRERWRARGYVEAALERFGRLDGRRLEEVARACGFGR